MDDDDVGVLSGGGGGSSSAATGSTLRRRRTRLSERDPVLITLSSGSDSDSDSKPQVMESDKEDIKLEAASTGSRKRLAHINAELIRKFSSLRWPRRSKKGNCSRDTDSSSSGSDVVKVKKRVQNKKRKNLTSTAAITKRKYFKTKKCISRRGKGIKPYQVSHSLQRRSLRNSAPTSESPKIDSVHVSPARSVSESPARTGHRTRGRPPRLKLVGEHSHSGGPVIGQKRQRGRPRKHFPVPPPVLSSSLPPQQDEHAEASAEDNAEDGDDIAKEKSCEDVMKIKEEISADEPPPPDLTSEIQSDAVEKTEEKTDATIETENKVPNVPEEKAVEDLEQKQSEKENKSLPPKKKKVILVKKRGRPKAFIRGSDKMVKKVNKMKKHTVKPITRKMRPVLQNTSCFDVPAKIAKCRECRIAYYNKSKKNQHSYCRFLEYRKLFYARNGAVHTAGFAQDLDATLEDKRSWLPTPEQPPDDLTTETSKALLVQVGDQFCDLIEQESEAIRMHIGNDRTMTWKRIVNGVREMCDVCETTLFNIHWVCPKCGLAVCIDCYKGRKQGLTAEQEDENQLKGRDEYLWLLCNGRQPHEQSKLIMAQIVPGNALWIMRDAMHRARDKWKITAYCQCRPQKMSDVVKKHVPTGICKQLMCSVAKTFTTPQHYTPAGDRDPYLQNDHFKGDAEISESAMNWLANDSKRNGQENGFENNSETPFIPCFESIISLKDIFRPNVADPRETIENTPPLVYSAFSIDDIIECVIEAKVEKTRGMPEKGALQLFNHRYPQPNSGRDPLPIRIFTTTESSMMYSEVPHSWLCNGRLLLLHEANHSKNLELFQEQWKRGQPIMVMGVDKRLDMSLWHPDGFCRDFGEVRNDLVDCKTGSIIRSIPMRKFWEGFENFDKRMKDEHGEYMLLKLKDWPPGEDFSEKLPDRFHDLMRGLPLPEYTHRDGIFNLAGRLPLWFVRPDLGPKMYNAYGSALFPSKGTTNLHLDISDAVNVMVYVGVPHDGRDDEHIQEAFRAIDEGGCDSLMRERVRARGVRPGALWHIYNARDADKIRDMLMKVAIERGEKLEAQHDPIHDQSWYIDTELRKRLYHEYGVEGYAIAQCLGDAVFIPAGAPHQVRNLQSCVKVAEDFVSPENIGHCFKLTQEFRGLSDTHTNHEDKLQIKNIIYHVVKDALSYLVDPEAARMYHLVG